MTDPEESEYNRGPPLPKKRIEVPHRSSESTRQREGWNDDPSLERPAERRAETAQESIDGTARRSEGEQDRAGDVDRGNHGGRNGDRGKQLRARGAPGALREAVEALGRDIAHEAALGARGRGASAALRARARWEAWARRTGHAHIARASESAAPRLWDWPADLERACATEILEALREACTLEAGGGAASPAQGLSAGDPQSTARALARAQLDTLASRAERHAVCVGLAQVGERLRRDGAPQAWTIPIQRLEALAKIRPPGWMALAQGPAWFATAVLTELDAGALAEPAQRWLGTLCARAAQAIAQRPRTRADSALRTALAGWRWRTARPPLGVVAVLGGTGQWEAQSEEAWGGALACEERERRRAAGDGQRAARPTDAEDLRERWRARSARIREEVEGTIERRAQRVLAEWARGGSFATLAREGTRAAGADSDAGALLEESEAWWDSDASLGGRAPEHATLEERHAEMVWVAAPTSAARALVSTHLDSGHEDNAAWRPRAIAVRARTPGSEQIGMVQAGGQEVERARTEALRAFARAARARARQR